MRSIQSRADIAELISTFYQAVRKDDLLGPVFHAIIPDDSWPAHMETLTNFWETNLFARPRYKGNPVAAHRTVDTSGHGRLTQLHFARWLALWIHTIDGLFECPRAELAKNNARKMAIGLYMAVEQERPFQ